MDTTIPVQINKLLLDYSASKEENLLDEIEYLLKLLEYQSWQVKSQLRLIEHPNKFKEDKLISSLQYKFSCNNAYSKYHLILPLLMHLFSNHYSVKSALNTSLDFMSASKEYLLPGDFAKTNTGAQRFITNTRFASFELRNLGLLRSDSKHFYKYWQLSLLGIVVAGLIYDTSKDNLAKEYFDKYQFLEAKPSAYNIHSKFNYNVKLN